MLKLLLFVALFFGLIYYVFILPFKPRNQVNDNRTKNKRTKSGNMNVDHAPDDRRPNSGNYKGGEYIDYEEVKD